VYIAHQLDFLGRVAALPTPLAGRGMGCGCE
jgi:hypothetical protein